jgi:hypothetical protein
VRLGAIYVLGRIAKNSRNDREAIAEILTAYVRSHAPWPPTRPGQYAKEAPIECVHDLRLRTPDVQAVMTVLGRAQRLETEPPLLLYNGDLRRAGLRDAHLEKADLRGAHLEGSDLRGAHLEGAVLAGASLKWADFTDVRLEAAIFDDIQVKGKLVGAQLEAIMVGPADALRRAIFREGPCSTLLMENWWRCVPGGQRGPPDNSLTGDLMIYPLKTSLWVLWREQVSPSSAVGGCVRVWPATAWLVSGLPSA